MCVSLNNQLYFSRDLQHKSQGEAPVLTHSTHPKNLCDKYPSPPPRFHSASDMFLSTPHQQDLLLASTSANQLHNFNQAKPSTRVIDFENRYSVSKSQDKLFNLFYYLSSFPKAYYKYFCHLIAMHLKLQSSWVNDP